MRKSSLSQIKLAPSEDKHGDSKTEASDSAMAPRSCHMCLGPLPFFLQFVFLFALVLCVLLNTFSCGKLTLDSKLFSNTTSL